MGLEAVGDGRAIARINSRRECRILDHVSVAFLQGLPWDCWNLAR